ncbi:ATP-binding protein [Priestia megaterium]|uniref:ATP-binding protein n=1 Tax=Priestia megaterium TaxID=1404 RepID=UPI002B250583|nr:ATP-binding protein [Priestia megaterium]MEB2294455.1 ATP-binding protein [Priestia megaterium]
MKNTHPLVEIRDSLLRSNIDPNNEYRKEIVGLFSDYRNPWDILTELIQNAVDAINENETIDEGVLKLEINTLDRKIIIYDNGHGIPHDKIKDILVPNVSINKSSSRTYGYKGVGLSFVSHLTKVFEVETVHRGLKSKYSIHNSIDWVANRSDINIVESLQEPEISSEKSYTQISITLDGQYSDSSRTLQSLDNFFDWATNPKVLEFVLRTKTAVGNTSNYFGKELKKNIKVWVTINNESPFQVEYNYLSPFDSNYSKGSRFFLTKSIDESSPYQQVYTDPTKQDKEKAYRCLRHDFFGLKAGERNVTIFDLSILVCGETGITQLENEYEISPMKNDSFKGTTGIYLCVNGMPTDILLKNWDSGFDKRFFCIVNVGMEVNSEFDTGRKGISAHTRSLIVEKITGIENGILNQKIINGTYSLKNAAFKMVDKKPRGFEGLDYRTHLEKWDRQPDRLRNLSFLKIPRDENAIIAIFFELIGKKELNGYRIRYISQDAAFDFAFSYEVPEKQYLDKTEVSISKSFLNNLSYDYTKSPNYILGDRGAEDHVGEFKIFAEDIVNSNKQPLKTLDLLIVWDFDEDLIMKKGGNIIKISPDERMYDGVTHILRDTLGECQVICLRKVLEVTGYLMPQI